MQTGQMKAHGAGTTTDRHEAISWLVNRLRWERTLDRLRSTGEGRTEKAA
jgi:hypothetical protein